MKDLILPRYILTETSNWLKNWENEEKKALLLFGNPGVGKTSLAYHLAETHHYQICEFNASEDRRKEFLVNLKSLIQTKPFSNIIILLDEIDGAQTSSAIEFVKIVHLTTVPIIFTANSIRNLKSLRSVSKFIYLKPKLSDLASLIPKNKLKQFNHVTDFRQVGICTKHTSIPCDPLLTQSERILKMIKTGNYAEIQHNDVIILLDCSSQLYGYELFQFVTCLAAYDRYKRVEALQGLKPNIKVINETWFTKKRLSKKSQPEKV